MQVNDKVFITKHGQIIVGLVKNHFKKPNAITIHYYDPVEKTELDIDLPEHKIYPTYESAKQALQRTWTSHANDTIQELHAKNLRITIMKLEENSYQAVAYDTNNELGSITKTIQTNDMAEAKKIILQELKRKVTEKLEYYSDIQDLISTELN